MKLEPTVVGRSLFASVRARWIPNACGALAATLLVQFTVVDAVHAYGPPAVRNVGSATRGATRTVRLLRALHLRRTPAATPTVTAEVASFRAAAATHEGHAAEALSGDVTRTSVSGAESLIAAGQQYELAGDRLGAEQVYEAAARLTYRSSVDDFLHGRSVEAMATRRVAALRVSARERRHATVDRSGALYRQAESQRESALQHNASGDELQAAYHFELAGHLYSAAGAHAEAARSYDVASVAFGHVHARAAEATTRRFSGVERSSSVDAEPSVLARRGSGVASSR